MRGLPYSVTSQDILFFFKDFQLIPSSVKIGTTDGHYKTGDGAVLFTNA